MRIEKIREKISFPIIIFEQANLRYFTNTALSGILLITKEEELLISRDKELAEKTGIKTFKPRLESIDELIKILRKKKIKKIGVSFEKLSYSFFRKFSGFRLVDIDKNLRALREVKDKEEIQKIKKACELADKAMQKIKEKTSEGITERELRAEACSFLKECENPAFEFIVEAGENSLFTHYPPTDRKIKKQELIIIDLGFKVDGYCSDLTRTFCLKPNEKQKRLYENVLEAQETAFKSLAENVKCREIYAKIERFFKRKGLINYWKYGLGHGIGLEIHESPFLNKLSTNVLKKDMVFTIEPGLHVPGIGGVRIEDSVLLKEKPIKLTRTGYGLEL